MGWPSLAFYVSVFSLAFLSIGILAEVPGEELRRIYLPGHSFEWGHFLNESNWQTGGCTKEAGGSIILSFGMVDGLAGNLWAKEPIEADSFEVEFSFQLWDPTPKITSTLPRAEGFALWVSPSLPTNTSRQQEDWNLFGHSNQFTGLGVFFKVHDQEGTFNPSISAFLSDDESVSVTDIPTNDGINWRLDLKTIVFKLTVSPVAIIGQVRQTGTLEWTEAFKLSGSFRGAQYLGFSADGLQEVSDAKSSSLSGAKVLIRGIRTHALTIISESPMPAGIYLQQSFESGYPLNENYWLIGGSASQAGTKIELSNGMDWLSGYLWAKVPISSNSFEVEFSFQVHNPQPQISSTSLRAQGFALWLSPSRFSETTCKQQDWNLFGHSYHFSGLGVFFKLHDQEGKLKPTISALLSDNHPVWNTNIPTTSAINWPLDAPKPITFKLTVSPDAISGQVRHAESLKWTEAFKFHGSLLAPGYLGFSADGLQEVWGAESFSPAGAKIQIWNIKTYEGTIPEPLTPTRVNFLEHSFKSEDPLNPMDWQMGGSARPMGEAVVLSPGMDGLTGYLWKNTPVGDNNFQVHLQFQMHNPTPQINSTSRAEGFALWFSPSPLSTTTHKQEDWNLFGHSNQFTGLGVFFKLHDKEGTLNPSISALLSDGQSVSVTDIPTNSFFNWPLDAPEPTTFSLIIHRNVVFGRILYPWDSKTQFTLRGSVPFPGYLGFSADGLQEVSSLVESSPSGASVTILDLFAV